MENVTADIMNAIESIDDTTTLFYKQNEKKGFQMLEETIIKLTKAIEGILIYKREGKSQIVDEEKLNEVLENLSNAIGCRDAILISDMLEYELKIILQDILSKL